MYNIILSKYRSGSHNMLSHRNHIVRIIIKQNLPFQKSRSCKKNIAKSQSNNMNITLVPLQSIARKSRIKNGHLTSKLIKMNEKYI